MKNAKTLCTTDGKSFCDKLETQCACMHNVFAIFDVLSGDGGVRSGAGLEGGLGAGGGDT